MTETLAYTSLRDRLPRLDRGRAEAQNRALAIFASLKVQDAAGVLQVRATPSGWDQAEGALLFAAPGGWLAVKGDIIGGARGPALSAGADLPAALSTLARIEPFLEALERAAGHSLDPVGVESELRPGALTFDLTLDAEDGRVVHHLTVAVAGELPLRWPEPSWLARLGAAAPAAIACRIRADGPKLERQRLAALREGDLVLLPRKGQGWPARLEAPDGSKIASGWIDWPASQFLRSSLEETPMLTADEDTAIVQGGAPQGAVPIDQLPVNLRVVIGQVTTSVSALAQLQEGSTLLLPDLEDSPRVTVLAEDRAIAEGRLMAVGEAYGVLIERIHA